MNDLKLIKCTVVMQENVPMMSEDGGRYIIHGEDGHIYQIDKDSLDVDSLPVIFPGKDGEGNSLLLHVFKEKLDTNETSDTTASQCGQIKFPAKKWIENETKFLLGLYSELHPQIKNRKIPSMKKMWEIVEQRMLEAGITCTAVQAENRWKTLERAYKKSEDNVKETGRARLDFVYQNELDELLRKRPNINPPVLRGPGMTVKRLRSSDSDASEPGNSNESKSNDSSCTPTSEDEESQPRKTTDKRDRGRSSTTSQEVAKFRTMYEEMLKKREEAKERHHKEKMDLIRQLLEKH